MRTHSICRLRGLFLSHTNTGSCIRFATRHKGTHLVVPGFEVPTLMSHKEEILVVSRQEGVWQVGDPDEGRGWAERGMRNSTPVGNAFHSCF